MVGLPLLRRPRQGLELRWGVIFIPISTFLPGNNSKFTKCWKNGKNCTQTLLTQSPLLLTFLLFPRVRFQKAATLPWSLPASSQDGSGTPLLWASPHLLSSPEMGMLKEDPTSRPGREQSAC